MIMLVKYRHLLHLFFLIFSPILSITQYGPEEYFDGSIVFVCFSLALDIFPCIFFIGSIVLFFIFPLVILICIYALIAKSLMTHPTMLVTPRSSTAPTQSVIKYRKQVILMLGTVVLAFFICLLPFRALTLWIIIAPEGSSLQMGLENYYNILYFCRIMFHINSAVNPILYNIMSSKFRGGFFKLCGVKSIKNRFKSKPEMTRKSTTSSSTHTSSQQTSESYLKVCKNQLKYSTSLKEVKEIKETNDSTEAGECSNTKQPNLTKNVYVRAPLMMINGMGLPKLPKDEIYV